MACPELVVSENCNEQTCVVAGLPCGEFRDCFRCVDVGMTAPRVCQFCVQNTASASGVRLGVCQSKFNVDGNATSGQTACVEGFDLRVTNAPQCAMVDSSATSTSTGGGGTETSGTAAPMIVSMVNVTTAFALLDQNSSVATLNVTLPNGITFLATAVSANESDSNVALQLDNGGLGVRSIVAENDTARVRKGFSIVFTFRFPVSFQFLALREFEDASDVGSLEFKHTEGSQRAGQPVGAIVTIRSAESRYSDATAAGFTEYTIAAVGDESEFTIEAFEFSALGSDALTGNGTEASFGGVSTTAATALMAETLNIPLIVGVVCGAVALLAVIGVVIGVILRQRGKRAPSNEMPLAPSNANDKRSSLPAAAHHGPLRSVEHGPISAADANGEYASMRADGHYAKTAADFVAGLPQRSTYERPELHGQYATTAAEFSAGLPPSNDGHYFSTAARFSAGLPAGSNYQ
jgi:hypothetical protein